MRALLYTLIHHLRTENADPVRLGWAVGLGMFVGILPLYGMHTVLCLALAFLLRLNKVTMVLATGVSLPMFAPILIAAGIILGDLLRYGRFDAIPIAEAKTFLSGLEVVAGSLPDKFVSCFLGDTIIGAVAGSSCGFATYLWAKRRRNASNPADGATP